MHEKRALLPSENRLTTERNESEKCRIIQMLDKLLGGEIVGVDTLAKPGVYELDILFEGKVD